MTLGDRFDRNFVSADGRDIGSRPIAPAACGIAFMAKASTPGCVKTRLVPPLTFDEAAALNTAFLQDVAGNVLAAARCAPRHAGIAGYAAYGPVDSADFFRRTLPPRIALIGAALPDFGDCLLHTVGEILGRGHGSAVVLNSDSPTLPTAYLVETAAWLAQPGDRAVLGPSADGGYYLLGLKAAHRRMFEGVAWSTERVAAQTLARAQEIDLEIHTLPIWYDVDDGESLGRLRAEVGSALTEPLDPRGPYRAAATAALLDRFCCNRDFIGRVNAALPIERLPA